MFYPTVSAPEQTQTVLSAFAGYHRSLHCSAGEWYDDCNLTAADYPVLTQRGSRSTGPCIGSTAGIFAKDKLGWVRGGSGRLYYGGTAVGLTLDPDTSKQFVSMGARVVIFPDKVYWNTADPEDCGSLEAAFTTGPLCVFSPCTEDGDDLAADFIGPDAPDTPSGGSLWLDTSCEPHTLRQYGSDGVWTELTGTCVRLTAEGLGAAFSPGDGITLSGCASDSDTCSDQAEALNGSHVISACEQDWLMIPGLIDMAFVSSAPVTAARTVPDLDFVVEAQNRLWGCRYGTGPDGPVNELYCSKLGDPCNWQVYQGLSTDSWTAGVGSDGPFTGASVYGGCPLFFKEDTLHKVYISSSGAHQVVTQSCRGVQAGCSRSLAIVNEVLYYRVRSGFCAYAGSSPYPVGEALDGQTMTEVCAGVCGSRYHVSGKDADGQAVSFVYDTGRSLWHRESPARAVCYARLAETLYWLDEDGCLGCACLQGDAQTDLWDCTETETISWSCETGILDAASPDHKYLSRFRLRLCPEEGASVSLQLQYDSSGVWEDKGTVAGPGLHSITIPVLPRRCDHLRLRLQGTGRCRVTSLACLYEQGSELDL